MQKLGFVLFIFAIFLCVVWIFQASLNGNNNCIAFFSSLTGSFVSPNVCAQYLSKSDWTSDKKRNETINKKRWTYDFSIVKSYLTLYARMIDATFMRKSYPQCNKAHLSIYFRTVCEFTEHNWLLFQKKMNFAFNFISKVQLWTRFYLIYLSKWKCMDASMRNGYENGDFMVKKIYFWLSASDWVKKNTFTKPIDFNEKSNILTMWRQWSTFHWFCIFTAHHVHYISFYFNLIWEM